MSLPRSEFEAAARTLLDPHATPLAALEAARGLHRLCANLVGAPDHDEAQRGPWGQPTQLATGKAIDPESAGRCVQDYARTRAFAWGVREGIEATLDRVEERPLRVVYAGTGPFAILALLQAPWFPPDEVRFTCLDIHPTSLAAVESLATQLGYRDHLDDLVEADAADWEPSGPVHGLIIEVMLKALHQEPQVAVTRHLTRFLAPAGFLVPEAIELRLALLDAGAELRCLADPTAPPARSRVDLGPVLRLDRDAHREDAGGLRPRRVDLPDSIPSGHGLHILTDITTQGSTRLVERESGLTYAAPVDAEIGNGALEVRYEVSERPCLLLRPAD